IIQAVTNSPLLAGNPNRDIPVFIVIAPIVLLRTGGIQTYPIKYCLADVELNFTFLATVIVPIAGIGFIKTGFAPIFPDTCYHLTHYWLAAVDIPVASDNPVHYADAIRYNARTPLQGSLLPLTRLVWA